MHACPKCQRQYTGSLTTCPEDGEILIPDEITQHLDKELKRGDIVGEYVIEAKIGSGTFGSVYRAIQPLIGKQVAIKILGHRYSADPTVVSRFIAEARAVNQIRHRNIIDIFSFGQLPDGRHYHIMELLNGATLDHHLRERGGRLPLVEVILILRPLARALDAAHVSGIAHRDLKPANVFLGRDDDGTPFPKLLDFGIAKLMSNDLPRQHVTGTGVAVGTPDYMSPEQCQGPDVDHRTDIYAFGVMAYQLMTGKLPFIGNNVVEVLVKQMTAAAEPPSKVSADLPKAIDAPVLWMMEKDKTKRPPDLATAISALEMAANASGISVPVMSSITGDPAMTPVMIPSLQSSGSVSMLADPALSATLPSDVRGSGDRIAETKPRRSPLWIAAIVVGVVVGGAFAATLGFQKKEAVVLTPVPDPVPKIIVEQPPLPATVKIEVRANEGTQIIGPGGILFGTAPATITLPRGSEPIAIELSMSGYITERFEVVPTENGQITTELKKDRAKKKKVEKKKKAASMDDIEAFGN